MSPNAEEHDGDEHDGDETDGDETDETYDEDELAEDGLDAEEADEEGDDEVGEQAKPRAKRPRVPLGAPLTGKQRRYLRSLGHNLEPLVQLGKHGLTPGVVDALDEALARHELVKVRLGTECPDDRDEVADKLGPALAAHVAQTIGRTILVYRRHPQKPTIHLPKG